MSYFNENIQAGVPLRLTDKGRFFQLQSLTTAVTVRLYLNKRVVSEQENAFVNYTERFFNTGAEGFDTVEIVSTVTQQIQFVTRYDSEASLPNDVNVSGGDISVTSGSKVITYPDIVAAAAGVEPIIAADATNSRKHVDISCPVDYRWGDANVGAAQGVLIPGGMVASIDSSDAIYLYVTAACAISVTEVKK